jgi:hypothetical protein
MVGISIQELEDWLMKQNFINFTGTQAGDYLVTGPNWKGTVPQGMKQISSPNNSVLVIGRVLVENDNDLSTAYGLAKQIQLTPLDI